MGGGCFVSFHAREIMNVQLRYSRTDCFVHVQACFGSPTYCDCPRGPRTRKPTLQRVADPCEGPLDWGLVRISTSTHLLIEPENWVKDKRMQLQ